jgi:Ca2+-binding RTX toxin-like protein
LVSSVLPWGLAFQDGVEDGEQLAHGAVSASLAIGTANGGPNIGSDRLFSIENLHGTTFNDVLDGNDGANVLTGHYGSESLTGRGGADRFDYNSVTDSSPNTPDLIHDFSRAQGDKIDLVGIDAKAHGAGQEAFTFIGQSQFTAEGQLRYYQQSGRTYVEANTDNTTAGPEMRIDLAGLFTPQATDFVL